MGAQLRIVRRRIKSVQSTQKITRAMELIASSRIVKAQQRVEAVPALRGATHARHGGPRGEHGLGVASRCLPIGESPTQVGVLVAHVRPRAGGRVQRQRDQGRPRAAGRVRARGLEPVVYVVGQEGDRVLPLPRCADPWATGRASARCPSYVKAEEIGRTLIADFADGAIDELALRVHGLPIGVHAARDAKRFLPIAPEEVDGPRRRGRPPRVPLRAGAGGDPGSPVAAVLRSRRSTRRCWSRRPRRTPHVDGR